MSEKNKRFQVSEWFNSQVEARTYASLSQKNEQFTLDHANDTNEQLAAYINQCAEELGKTPSMEEVIGGKYIAYRFGGWTKAVLAAELPLPGAAPKVRRRKIFQEEYLRQTALFKQELQDNRDARKAVRQEQAEVSKAEKEARRLRDAEWGEAHQDLSDEELLDYLRKCAAELGYSPYSRDVVGGTYIAKRLDGWAMALYRAGLPMAQGMKPPTKAQLATFRAKQNGCQPGK